MNLQPHPRLLRRSRPNKAGPDVRPYVRTVHSYVCIRMYLMLTFVLTQKVVPVRVKFGM